MLALLLLSTGCRAAPPPVAIDAVVRHCGAASDRRPMVVALHGLGDTPEHFIGALDGLSGFRVVALRAPHPWSQGSSWFDGSVRQMDDATLVAALHTEAEAVAARIAAATERWPTDGDPIVTGFSQGGMLSWALPVIAPATIGAAVPVAGFIPVDLTDAPASPPQRATPIRALHGTEDDVLPIARARAARDDLAALGFDAALAEFPGVPHAISPEERAAWHRAIAEVAGVSPLPCPTDPR